ncbi:tail fiber protein [Cronobacter sakazakii]
MSEAISGVSILGAAVKHAVKADVQFYESYGTSAFNRKLQGIVTPGIYAGFMPVLAGGLDATITSLQAENGRGVASIDVGEHQLSVKQLGDVTLTIPTNATTRVMLEANYEFGVKTSQVDSTSSIPSARIFLADVSEPEEANQLELCRFIVPAGATQLTASMLVVSYRKNRALGIALSDAIDSDRDDLAATPSAVKKAVESLTGVNPSSLLDTIAKLAAALNNDPKYYKTIADLLALKAPLASPLFTGTPKAPTPDPADNSTLIATTNFVHEAIAKLVGSSPEALDTLAELAAALGNDANFSKTVLDALANKQPKDSTLSALAGRNIAGLLDYLGLMAFRTTPDFTSVSSPLAKAFFYLTDDFAWGVQTNDGVPKPLAREGGGTGATTAEGARENLELKSAALRDVGTAAGQIPDMSSFPLSPSTAGFPGGLQLRFGQISTTGNKTFSTPFPNACLGILFGLQFAQINNSWLFTAGYDAGTLTRSGFNFRANCNAGGSEMNQPAGEYFYYFAWGY